MPVGILNQTFDIYENGLNLLSERLRKNWMQKLNSVSASDDSLTNLTWLYVIFEFPLTLPSNRTCIRLAWSWITLTNRMILIIYLVGPRYITGLILFPGNNQQMIVCNQRPFSGSLLDPQVRYEYRTKWTGKPPFSYATLICLAMREIGKPKVTLSDIYGWIMNNFTYYRHTDSSWQNSVRHNLSLNKCFEKVPREKGERGKGGFWRVNPKHVDWLEANLAKCQRAAPPPGPAPPIPRSLIIQQRQQQQQQQQQQLSTSKPTSTYSFAPPSLTSSIGLVNQHHSIGEIRRPLTFDPMRRCSDATTLSPLSSSASSSSGVSFSPLSTSSASPTTNIDCSGTLLSATTPCPSAFSVVTSNTTTLGSLPTLTKTPCVGSLHFRSATESEQQQQQQQQVVNTFRPSVEVSHPPNNDSSRVPTMAPVIRRRKSPLHQLGQSEQSMDDGCFYEQGLDHSDAGSPFYPYPYGKARRGGGEHCPSTQMNDMGILSSSPQQHHRVQRPVYAPVSRGPAQTQMGENVTHKSGRDVNDWTPTAAHIEAEEEEDEESSSETGRSSPVPDTWKVGKRLCARQPRMKLRVYPTRVLPPRRRYSRWARPQSIRNDRDWVDTPQKSRTLAATRLTKAHKTNVANGDEPSANSQAMWSQGKGNREPGTIHHSNSKDSTHEASSDKPRNDSPTGSRVSLPRLQVRSNGDYWQQQQQQQQQYHHQHHSTPPYVPAGLSPHARLLNGRDSASSNNSISSRGSTSLHGSSMPPSDGHLYHTITPNRHSTPRRVETQTCKPLQNPVNVERPVHFTRLYPTSVSAESCMGPSPDQMRMPKWAAVFLPEGEQTELEPMLFDKRATTENTLDLFGQLSTNSSSDPFSICDAIQSGRINSAASSSSCPTMDDDEDDMDAYSSRESQVNDQPSFFSNQDVTNPQNGSDGTSLLGGIELDSGDLDLDTLDGFVEASGPIPLDLDFSLTANLAESYANLSADFWLPNVKGSGRCLVSTNLARSASSSIELSDLTNGSSWLGDFQSPAIGPPSYLLPHSIGTEVMFDHVTASPNQSNDELGLLHTPPLT